VGDVIGGYDSKNFMAWMYEKNSADKKKFKQKKKNLKLGWSYKKILTKTNLV
jgi:hypothetical protein